MKRNAGFIGLILGGSPVAVLIAGIILGLCPDAGAEPYIAVRTGFKCSQCHVNGTGGGKRTDFGNVYSQYQLLMQSPLNDSLPYGFDPKLNKAISIGSNWRVEQVHTQPYSYQGKSASTYDAPVIRESNVYVNIELVKKFLNAYVDQTVGSTVANREFFAAVNPTPNSWFKFGNMLLPYGFRLMDDQAFIRDKTNYTYNRSGLGYEVGYEPGPFSFAANITADQFSSVGSMVVQKAPLVRTLRLGGSYGGAVQKADRGKKQTYGGFGGFSFGMFTFLGEQDWIRDDTLRSVADYSELDFLPLRGLNFKLVYEYLWPDTKIPRSRDGRMRAIVGVEPFITQFMQLGLYYRKNDWIPQNLDANQDEIYGRLHVFF